MTYRTRMKMVLETAPGIRLFPKEMWSNCSSMENSRQREPLLLWAAPSCPQRDYLLRDIHEGIASCGPSTHNRRPNGLRFFNLSADLAMLGFQVERLKTGTSPRVNGRSIDFSVCEIQPGDAPEALFSYRSRDILKRDSEPFCTLDTWGDEKFPDEANAVLDHLHQPEYARHYPEELESAPFTAVSLKA